MALLALTAAPAASVEPALAPGVRLEVVAERLPRPVQLAFAGPGHLVVLSQGWSGAAAGEIYHLSLDGGLPADAGRAPRIVLPFSTGLRKTAFGSLAVDPRHGDVFLGEENGNRVYRLRGARELAPVVVGINHLVGGGGIALDGAGRLIVVDYASPETHLRSEAPLPPSLAWLMDEGYRGPLLFRVDVGDAGLLPRRVDLLAPVLPRGWGDGRRHEPLARVVAATVGLEDDIVCLTSLGEVFRLGLDGHVRPLARLPAGHYHRTNLGLGPDGSVYVSAGFHIRHLYRIAPAGAVTWVARDLGDPGGIAVDAAGVLYVAETALHRVIRLLPAP